MRRIVQTMQTERIEEPNDGTMQKLILLLSILEPIVVNEQNAYIAIEENIIEWLGKILILQDNFFSGILSYGQPFKDAA